MSTSYPRFKAAACHTASVFLDAIKSADKASDLIAEAARKGAKLVVFPESFIPGFPVWAALQAPILPHNFFEAMASQAVRLDGPELAKVRTAAQKNAVVVSIGITEGTDASVGCLWNSRSEDVASAALRRDGPELAKVRTAAQKNAVVVSIGITEGTDASVGCLWNSNVLIGTDGAIINHHRKRSE